MVAFLQSAGVSAAGPRCLRICLIVSAMNFLGCHQLNPAFREESDDEETSSAEDETREDSGGNAALDTGAGGSLDTDLSLDASNTLDTTESLATTHSGEDSSMSSELSSTDSSLSSETESSNEKPWSYCNAPVSLCLNMNDPARSELTKDALTFGTGQNASYAVSDKPKWPEVSWLDLKGLEPVRSNKTVKITTVTGKADDQLGFDVWLRHDPEWRPELMVSIEGMMSLGRGDDGRIRCNGFWDPQLSMSGAKWRSTSRFSKGAGDWQHVACYAKGTTLGIWFLGGTWEGKDHLTQNGNTPINPRSEAKIILGKSDWIEYKAGMPFGTSSADIAGIRIWNNVDTMLRVLNEEHAAQANP